MEEQLQTLSLDEQLREEKRLAAAYRRRRRKRWLIPLLIVLALILLIVILTIVQKPPEKQETVQETEPSDLTATLLAAGDITIPQPMLNSVWKNGAYDFHDCFSPLTHTVMLADLAVVNVEGNFCGTPYRTDDARYPESLLTALRDCGFDMIQTANSYSIENGLAGLISTKDAIEDAGLLALGTFRTEEEQAQCGGVTLVDCNGIRIAMIGLTKGTNGLHLPEGGSHSVNLLFSDYDTNYSEIDRDGILSLIRNARDQAPDVIVCMVHWGSENTTEISDSQRDVAELMLDNGVDLIIGTHSHLIGPIEGPSTVTSVGTREKGLVAYSLGDLLSASEKESTHVGCMLQVTFSKHGDTTRIQDINYIPTYSAYPSEEYENSDYRVYDALDAIYLYESSYVNRISEPLYLHIKELVDTAQERAASDYLVTKEFPSRAKKQP